MEIVDCGGYGFGFQFGGFFLVPAGVQEPIVYICDKYAISVWVSYASVDRGETLC